MHLQKAGTVVKAGRLALFGAGLSLAVAGSTAVNSRTQQGQVGSVIENGRSLGIGEDHR